MNACWICGDAAGHQRICGACAPLYAVAHRWAKRDLAEVRRQWVRLADHIAVLDEVLDGLNLERALKPGEVVRAVRGIKKREESAR